MRNFKISKFNFLFLLFALGSITLTTSCKDDDPMAELQESTFGYDFNNGQVVPTAAYLGTHPTDFSASIMVSELENGNANITVTLNNTIDGQTYHTHAHDAADPADTPNGTPYNETPNSDVFVSQIEGNGGSVTVSMETSMSFTEITTTYEGFFVVHDPLQAITTTDISTYLIVGGFAREQAGNNFATSTFNYDFNTGQLVADFAYSGSHNDNLSASIIVDELAGDQSRVTVTINNTVADVLYHTHAHDMADAATTPNGTPYIETPNGDVFAAPLEGNGGTTSMAKISTMSYSDITTTYDGFFVIHDPLQEITTTDPTTYVILGVFAR